MLLFNAKLYIECVLVNETDKILRDFEIETDLGRTFTPYDMP